VVVDLWGNEVYEDLGVFKTNRERPIHRWYPFVEGYSAELVDMALREHPDADAAVLDPFGGSGTTALAASQRGVMTYFCEVNPYLSFVADAKVNQVRLACGDPELAGLTRLAEALEGAGIKEPVSREHPLLVADARREFFPAGAADVAVATLEWIASRLQGAIAALASLAVATSLIPASNMVRRTDLRRRTKSDPPPVAIRSEIARRLRMIGDDVRTSGESVQSEARQVAQDVRALKGIPGRVSLVVTSPPYLNGTNYSRNTKLELLALRYLDSEGDLARLRDGSISAGINYVCGRRPDPIAIPSVEAVASEVEKVAYDQRIPALVRNYFSDMQIALRRVREVVDAGVPFYLDIGDSKFCGVHIPTDQLLAEIAFNVGWRVLETRPIRSRRSFDGTDLRQVLLRMEAQ
jgi:DNA modification methylase